MPDVVTPEHLDIAGRCREILAVYRDAEDLINIVAYVKGSSPKIDFALEKIDALNNFLRQKVDEKADFHQSLERLKQIQAKPADCKDEKV